MRKLLVYGTLKRGFGNHRIIKSGEFLGEFLVGPFTMYNMGAFPGCTTEEHSMIQAELYQINESQFEACDRLEGYPYLYTRKEVRYGPLPDDVAWMYFINSSDRAFKDEDRIDSGVWPPLPKLKESA